MPDSQPASANRAVFLSYASEDAEAVERIAVALRAAGVEVWFDKNELTGGDAWDQKIRGQIKSCALFVPVISAATNARREGYFRREWKIAVDRTHDMDEALPFLVPVVIDATTDAGAFVPEKFREVQWTRLPGGETPEKFCARLKTLLGGSGLEAGRPRPAQRDEGVASPTKFRPSRPWLVPKIIGSAAIVALALWQPWKKSSPPPATPAPGANPAVLTVSEAAELTSKAYDLTQRVGFTRDDLAQAEAFVQRATELAPDLARARSVHAWVRACYLMRNWDVSDRRLQDVQTDANRALGLDPNDADALNALSLVFEKQRLPVEAEKVALRATKTAPDNARSWLQLARALRAEGRRSEARQLMEETVRRFPKNVLCHYELANDFAGIGFNPEPFSPANVNASLEHLDAAIAIQPFGSAVLLKAMWEASGRGDLRRMRAELDRLETLPITDRTEDRAVYLAMWGGLLERDSDRVLATSKLTARAYFEDTLVAGPKGWSTGLAYRIAGKEGLARQEWLAAEAVQRQRLAEQPGNTVDQVRLAITLAWLGEDTAAQQIVTPIETAWREDTTQLRARGLLLYYAARGDAGRAVPYLRMTLNYSSFVTDHLLLLDPWWDKLRGAPEFEALVAEAKQRLASSAAPNDKSVAVLAFADNSPGRDSEYFSDGISDELINALGKVPGLKVPARTSSFYFKGKSVPVPEIAKQLGVAYVIEGSVQRAGEKVKISARLSKAADGFQVWADSFLRDAKDVFAVEEEIAGLVAKQLSLKLGVSSAASKASVDPEAFDLYVQARQAWNLRTSDGHNRAEEMLNRALALEPNFARAHAALADVWIARGQNTGDAGRFGDRDSPLQRRVVAKIQQALQLDPDSAEAHASLGSANWIGWNLPEAEHELRHAIKLNANYASAHQWLGRVLMSRGLIEEAMVELAVASEVDPLSSRIADNRALASLDAGRYSEALALYDRALALRPDSVQAIQQKAITEASLGRRVEAAALLNAILEKDWPARDNRVEVLALSGLRTEAEAHFAAVDPRRHDVARLLLFLGKPTDALGALNQDSVTAMDVDQWLYLPAIDPIRSDPRFAKFLATLGLTEAHARAQAWRKTHPPEKPAVK